MLYPSVTRLDSIANGLGIKQNGSSHDAVEDVDVPGTLMRVRFTLTSSRIQVQVNFSKTLIPKHSSSVKYILTIDLKGGDTYDG